MDSDILRPYGRVVQYGNAVNRTTTGDVTTRSCALLGFYVNSTTSGTIVLRKGGSGGTVLNGTITPAVGFHQFPASAPGGLHVTVGGTINVTFFVIED
jgi:hypothetical protein